MRTRIGLIVPRYQQTAVARNRVKRHLRELSRTRVLPADIPVDLVIRIRPEAYRASFLMLAADIDRVLVQLLSFEGAEPGSSGDLDRPARRMRDDS
jgi:ribonuclease P protein component